jgi:predicted nuclease of restriction endonuclease-like (RecB) superfamily
MTNNQYKTFLIQLKQHIEESRLKAILSVNKQMIQLYWEIGSFILKEQKKQGWGAKVIDNLSKDLWLLLPGMKGLSARNLKRMRRFTETYPDFEIVPTVLAQTRLRHNIILLDKSTN